MKFSFHSIESVFLSEHRFLERLSSTVRLIEGKEKKVGRFKLIFLSEIGHKKERL